MHASRTALVLTAAVIGLSYLGTTATEPPTFPNTSFEGPPPPVVRDIPEEDLPWGATYNELGKMVIDAAPPGAPRLRHAKIDKALRSWEGRVEVIVVLQDATGARATDWALQERMVELTGPENFVVSWFPDIFVAMLTQQQLADLADHPNIAAFRSNLPVFKTLLNDAVQIVQAVNAWDIQIGGQHLTGAGQTIAIVDTGIDFTHADLAAKNIVGCNLKCYDPDDPQLCEIDCTITDLDGHGTHVAGIAGADGGISGIARGADLVALKVFPDDGSGATELAIARAIYWAAENREAYGISVISISVGDGNVHTEPCDDFMPVVRNMVNYAELFGIPVVIATGNEASSDGINAPACIANAIAVAATNKDDTLMADFSNYDEQVLLFAPGRSIVSTALAGHPNDYLPWTGTSMSAPMVAGAIAIIKQVLDLQDQTMTPGEIEQLLFDTADPILDLPFENWRRINVYQAVQAIIDCAADITGEGVVGTDDILAVLGNWGACAGCPADVTGDGFVDVSDALAVLGAWGPCL